MLRRNTSPREGARPHFSRCRAFRENCERMLALHFLVQVLMRTRQKWEAAAIHSPYSMALIPLSKLTSRHQSWKKANELAQALQACQHACAHVRTPFSASAAHTTSPYGESCCETCKHIENNTTFAVQSLDIFTHSRPHSHTYLPKEFTL